MHTAQNMNHRIYVHIKASHAVILTKVHWIDLVGNKATSSLKWPGWPGLSWASPPSRSSWKTQHSERKNPRKTGGCPPSCPLHRTRMRLMPPLPGGWLMSKKSHNQPGSPETIVLQQIPPDTKLSRSSETSGCFYKSPFQLSTSNNFIYKKRYYQHYFT